jgi:predicted membrane metal-binding protein
LLEPQAIRLISILLGDDSGLPDTTRDAFRETGMTHIIAISGQTEAMVISCSLCLLCCCPNDSLRR